MIVALAQVDCALGDIEENGRRAREAIARARAQDADLIVFPELSLTGYSMVDDVALAPDAPAIAALGAEAGEMGVVVGFVEEGLVHTYNSAIYLEAGRAVHVQRKCYLPTYGRFEERKHFSPGQALRAFDTAMGRLAMVLCNDAWQAPLPFIAVHDGARMLIVPACSPLPEEAERQPEIRRDWRDLVRFHARFLQAYVLFVNRVGEEAGLRFWGGSQVVDPWGRMVAEAPEDEPALILAELDSSAVRRRRREIPLLKDPRLGLLRHELDRLASADDDD